MIDVDKFAQYAKGKVLIAGYGSLLSHASRLNFSQIDCAGIPISVDKWQRSWITRSMGEKQTYVGAVPMAGATLNAQLIALEFDESFHVREQDYRFSRLSPQDITLDTTQLSDTETADRLLGSTDIYICETLDVQPSTIDYPVNYSYIFTCLLGAYEASGRKGVQDFLQQTGGWQQASLQNDLAQAKYPRHALGDLPSNDHLYALFQSFLEV